MAASATALKSLPIDVPRAPWQRKAVAKVDGKADEEAPPDYFNLLSMALGMLGFYFKWRVASWLSLFFCLSSFTRVKTADLDMKQVFGPAMFSIMGIVTNFLHQGKT